MKRAVRLGVAVGVVALLWGRTAAAQTVFLDDFSAGLASWTASCTNINQAGETCGSNVDAVIFQSSPQAATLTSHSSCFSSPFDGAGSRLARTVNLPNGDYILTYRARTAGTLVGFCEGGTAAETRVRANGAEAALGARCTHGGSCDTCVADWQTITFNFTVTGGTADLEILMSGDDCADAVGWVDDISIAPEASPVPAMGPVATIFLAAVMLILGAANLNARNRRTGSL